jgi:hypothetical protein
VTVEVLAMGMVAFLTAVLYADYKFERAASRLRHDQTNIRVRLRRLEKQAFPYEEWTEEVG